MTHMVHADKFILHVLHVACRHCLLAARFCVEADTTKDLGAPPVGGSEITTQISTLPSPSDVV